MTHRATLPPPPKPFAALPKRKREFVKHYVRSGDGLDAYRRAGYKMSNASRNLAHKLLKEMQPYVRQQLAEYVSGSEMAILSLKAIGQLAEGAESEQVRLNAAKELLNRALPEGPKVVEHHHHSDKQQLSDAELTQRLKSLHDKLFLNAPAAEVVNINEQSRTGRVPELIDGTGGAEEV